MKDGTLKAPIFILGCHKSGTSLLRNLFDGHPDLVVLPTETHFFQYAGYGVEYPLRTTPHDPQTGEALLASFHRYLDDHSAVADRFSDAPGFAGYDKQLFTDAVRSTLGEENPAVLMTAYIHALYRALHQRPFPDSRRLVEKSVEHAEYAPVLRSFFPDSHFIHIVRNPYAVLHALKKREEHFPYLGHAARGIRQSGSCLLHNRMHLDRYEVLRYEDLLVDTETTMRHLAERLQIDFVPSMLQPTVGGESWQGNSTGGDTFSAVSAAPLDRWRSSISPVEIRLVNHACSDLLHAFDYEALSPDRTFIRPARGEGLKTYIKHRMFFYT